MDGITDDEILLRHVPAGTLWQAPGARITSANFQIRHDRNETGVSVTRLQITTPERLLELVKGSVEAGSRVAAARTGDVRAMGLRAVPKPLPMTRGMRRFSRTRPGWTTTPVESGWPCYFNSCHKAGVDPTAVATMPASSVVAFWPSRRTNPESKIQNWKVGPDPAIRIITLQPAGVHTTRFRAKGPQHNVTDYHGASMDRDVLASGVGLAGRRRRSGNPPKGHHGRRDH